MALAAHWSVDPTSLDERDLDVPYGWLGDLGEGNETPAPKPRAKRRPWWKLW